MISQREVQRRYADLMKQVATDPYYTDTDLTKRVNCFVCVSEKCAHVTKTKEVDSGTIPMLFTCEKCGEPAKSTFYRDIAPDQTPTFEWYRPALAQTLKLRRKEAVLEHVLKGGLMYRKIEVKTQTAATAQ